MYSSVILTTLTTLCNHHLSLFPKSLQTEALYPLVINSYSRSTLWGLLVPVSAFCFCEFDSSSFPTSGLRQSFCIFSCSLSLNVCKLQPYRSSFSLNAGNSFGFCNSVLCRHGVFARLLVGSEVAPTRLKSWERYFSEHLVHAPDRVPVSSSLGFHLSRIAGSYGNSIFNF